MQPNTLSSALGSVRQSLVRRVGLVRRVCLLHLVWLPRLAARAAGPAWRRAATMGSKLPPALLVGLLVLLPASGPVAAAEPAGLNITGTWASTTGAERLVFLPGGYFRTCFAGGKPGNAAMGQWKRLAPGRYAVEFTHTAAPDCQGALRPIRKHAASIVGQALISKGELALYVSGEFPPDLYRPVATAAPK